MTAEQLEELLGKVTQGEWEANDKGIHPHPYICGPETEFEFGFDRPIICYVTGHNNQNNITLIALAPSLARRVIAAEKLVEALAELPLGDGPLAQLVSAYREACK